MNCDENFAGFFCVHNWVSDWLRLRACQSLCRVTAERGLPFPVFLRRRDTVINIVLFCRKKCPAIKMTICRKNRQFFHLVMYIYYTRLLKGNWIVQGVIVSGHVLISCTHTSKRINKIASSLRCLRSADQNMAAHKGPLISTLYGMIQS